MPVFLPVVYTKKENRRSCILGVPLFLSAVALLLYAVFWATELVELTKLLKSTSPMAAMSIKLLNSTTLMQQWGNSIITIAAEATDSSRLPENDAVSQLNAVGPCTLPRPPHTGLQNTSRVLVCITSCNHMSLTERLLRNSTWDSRADVVIMDDASEQDIRGAFEQRYCVPVLRSPEPMGLTWHWNRCYALHRHWGYAAVILSNNDVVIPSGSLSELLDLLLGAAPSHVKWIGPVSSPGCFAGGHGEQHVSRLHPYLPAKLMQYIIPLEEAQAVQNAIQNPENLNRADSPPRVSAPTHDKQLYGFIFGLRNLTNGNGLTLEVILPPHHKGNVGQESAMSYIIDGAFVATRSYVHHDTSSTLPPTEKDRNDIMACHRLHFHRLNASTVA